MSKRKYFVVKEMALDDEPRVLSMNYSEGQFKWAEEISTNITFGLPVKEPVGEIVCELSKLNGVLDIWFLKNFISRRALDVVKGLGETHFQDWPVTLKTRKGKIDREAIRLINVLEPLSCIDRKHSKIVFEENDCLGPIELLVLDEIKIPKDRHLFRFKEGIEYVASAELVAAWQAIGVRGGKFIAPEEYRKSY